MSKIVALLGASNKPERFAFKAQELLKSHGHEVVLISPNIKTINGVTVLRDLDQINQPIDTLTMYVGPLISTNLKNQILKLKPKRIIFNPGSENPALEAELKKASIDILHDCTLVMLNSERF